MKKTCCVTGHRNIPSAEKRFVIKAITDEVNSAVEDGYVRFMSGFADGADLIFGRAVAEKKKNNPEIELIAVVPHRPRYNALTKDAETKSLLDASSEVVVMREEHSKSAYHERNRYMADRSQRIIGVYDGRKGGGTARTIQYGKRLGREVRIIAVRPSAESC